MHRRRGTTDDESGRRRTRGRPDVPAQNTVPQARRRGPASRCRTTAAGARRPIAPIPSVCSRSRRRPDCLTWSRSGMAGWRPRPSISIGGRPCRWPPTLRRCHEATSSSSCAAMRTCRTSGCSLRRSGPRCSTSRISTRRCTDRSSGISSASLRASSLPAARVASRSTRVATPSTARSGHIETRMAGFATMRAIDVYYAQVDVASILGVADKHARPFLQETVHSASHHDALHELPKLTAVDAAGRRRIVDHPPVITHPAEATQARIDDALAGYRETLEEDRRALLDRYRDRGRRPQGRRRRKRRPGRLRRADRSATATMIRCSSR